jgi:quaternary ammonium compound-resistance protein SugE
VNPWALLVIAGLLEVVWAIGLKASDGFTRFWPSAVTVVTAVASFWLLALAMKQLPVGTAYAVWVGIGAVGAAILGVVLFSEPVSPMRIAGIVLVVGGVAALKFA